MKIIWSNYSFQFKLPISPILSFTILSPFLKSSDLICQFLHIFLQEQRLLLLNSFFSFKFKGFLMKPID